MPQEKQTRAARARPGQRRGFPPVLLGAAVAIIIAVVIGGVIAFARGGDDSKSVIQKMDNARYDKQSQFLIATISYSGNHPEHIGCAAYGPENTKLIISGYTVLESGKADFFTSVGRKPDGTYKLICGERLRVGDSNLDYATTPQPGAKTFTAEVDAKRDPAYTVVNRILGRYQVPIFEIVPNGEPKVGAPRELNIAFDFFEDGSMVRGGEVVPLRFARQPDGTYRVEEQTPNENLLEVHTVRFDGQDVVTTTEFHWKGNGTFVKEVVWKRIGDLPFATSTAGVSFKDDKKTP